MLLDPELSLHKLNQIRLFKLLVAWCLGGNEIEVDQNPDGVALSKREIREILDRARREQGSSNPALTTFPQELVDVAAFCPTHPSDIQYIPTISPGDMLVQLEHCTVNA